METRQPLKRGQPLQAKTSLKSASILKSSKQLSSTGLKKRRSKRIDIKCHNLAREIWRMWGRCENCEKLKGDVQLQGAHILGTGAFPKMGADLRNGFCLCAMCHRYYTDSPREFSKFIETSWAEPYMNTLYRLARAGDKVDWEDRMDFLKEIKRAMLAGEITIAEAREYETN